MESIQNKILSIGLCTTDTREESYLERCVDSIITDARKSGYLNDIVIHIMDCDVNKMEAKPVIQLKIKYAKLFTEGTLRFSRVDSTQYPSFDRESPDKGETKERYQWRLKQCLDAGILFQECINLATYHLHLEDDIEVQEGFFDFLFKVLYSYEREDTSWSSIRFHRGGFIGHLFRGSDMEKLAVLLQVYYDEMPVDWLVDFFCQIKAVGGQKIATATSEQSALLKHIGVHSSLSGQIRDSNVFG